MSESPQRPVIIEYPDARPGPVRRHWRALGFWRQLFAVLLAVVIVGLPLGAMLSQARWWGQPSEHAVVERVDLREVDDGCPDGRAADFRLRVTQPRPDHPGLVTTHGCSNRWDVGERVTVRRTAPVSSGDEVLINPLGASDLALLVGLMTVVCLMQMGGLVWRYLLRPVRRTLRRGVNRQ